MLKIITSQLKVIPGKEQNLDEYALESATMLKNEPFSFQLAYSCDQPKLPLSLVVDSPLPAKCYRVDCLPITYAANDYDEPGYVTNDPGIVPDLLEERPTKPSIVRRRSPWGGTLNFEEAVDYTLNASKAWQSVLVTLNPDSLELEPGKYTVKLTLTATGGLTTFGEAALELEVIDAALPEQDFYVTNWFHVDCLCDYYKCEPYSEEFYRIFESFVKNMTAHRQNTLLLPAFTPALDTPIGHARRNVQLVDITNENGEWKFSFDRLAKFMRTASECGIKVFEHCHLFSQWGAKHTPNIYDTDGTPLFGWETDSTGAEYTAFLRAYLTAFTAFVHSEGYTDDRFLFHISDEPNLDMLPDYKKAYESIADLIAPFNTIDAMSSLEFYRQGLVKSPVATIQHADDFYTECDSFWVYYTCGPYQKLAANRLITNTPARTRILGAQMYRYGAKGFLHWGYNYYYDCMSEGWFDPRVNPCGYKQLPGCSYLAYPEKDGATPSFREKLMCEGYDDIRALRLYESLTSREEALALLTRELGEVTATFIPEGNVMHDFRQALNMAIKAKL